MRKRTTMNPRPAVPGKDDGYWVNLGTVAKIRQSFAKPRKPLGVFYALNLIMSDEKAQSFTVTNGCIASLCVLSADTVGKVLQELEGIGVIITATIPGAPKGIANTTITLCGEVRL
jgi:hypothetical protein